MKLTKNKSGIYVARYYAGRDKGMVSISTHQRDRRDALAVVDKAGLREIELSARAGVLSQDVINTILRGGKKISLSSLATEWKNWMSGVNMASSTAHNKHRTALAFILFHKFENEQPSAVQPGHISAYINRPSDVMASTRNLDLKHLRSFFDWMRNNNYVMTNPARLVRGINMETLAHEQKEKGRREPFTDEEVECVLKQALARKDDFWYAATLIGRHTGLRLGDICCLEWASITRENIVVWTGKTDVRVELNVIQKLLDLFDRIEKDDERYVFPAERHTYIDPSLRPILSMQFRRLCDRCGIKKSFHSLRRAKATEVYKEHGIEAARQQLGHANSATTQIYIQDKDL